MKGSTLNTSTLHIRNLSITYHEEAFDAVHSVDFSLLPGETVGLIGESGSGKSSLALAIMGLLPSNAVISGEIDFENANILKLGKSEMNRIRWNRIALVFQNNLGILNPVLTIREQISEALQTHTSLSKQEAKDKTEEYLLLVGLKKTVQDMYAHQVSGGMRQKILIAMALCCEPDVLLIDEPTTALDAVAKKEVVDLLLKLQKQKGFSMLVISHDLAVVFAMTSRVLVMYAGSIMEEGPTNVLVKDPQHPYTRGLVYASPALNPYRDMWGISGELTLMKGKHCPFHDRCNQCIEQCRQEVPPLISIGKERKVACLRGGIVTLLSGCGVSKTFQTKQGNTIACNQCNLSIRAGEVCALIGESGSGKTTLALMLSGSIPPDTGIIQFEDSTVQRHVCTKKKKGIQIVFQDPFTATNEHLNIEQIVGEPLEIVDSIPKQALRLQVQKALRLVQLPWEETFLAKQGFMLSGGQRQRVAIARALIMQPKLLIADEISAMLDPSTTATMLRLLKELQISEGFAMLYITHDVSLARKIADTVYVMQEGTIVENGPLGEVFTHPKAPFTQKLFQEAQRYAALSE